MEKTTPEVLRERDPVCGMSIDPRQAAFTVDILGATYHFCSAECRAAFTRDPARFVARPGTAVSRPTY